PEAGVGGTEPDSVRRYLAQIGKTPLLTAAQETQIGQQIERATSELVGALARLPWAGKCLVKLADRVRAGEAPAAELILLSEGGELVPQRIAPVLRAFRRVAREQRCLDRWRAQIEAQKEADSESDEETRAMILRAEENFATLLAEQPIRPSV